MKRAFSILMAVLGGISTLRGQAPAPAEPPKQPSPGTEQPSAIVVVGAGGTAEYAAQFASWGDKWMETAGKAGVRAELLGKAKDANNVREHLREALAAEPREGVGELWLVLLGHGTWDGRTGKFNVTQDDISTGDLAEWLAPIKRPVVVIAGFSAGGAFLKPLSAPSRVIVTATRAGAEENFARFGEFISSAIADAAADLDKDGEVSVLEAWLFAARKVAEFYQNEGRLATEHSLLDDNGDGLGTPADWFEGTRAVKRPKNGTTLDGLRAAQIHLVRSAEENALPPAVRARRDELEVEVSKLRAQKSTLKEGEYYERLERLLVELAHLYEP